MKQKQKFVYLFCLLLGYTFKDCALGSLVAYLFWIQNVGGSNPSAQTKKSLCKAQKFYKGLVVQRLERTAVNRLMKVRFFPSPPNSEIWYKWLTSCPVTAKFRVQTPVSPPVFKNWVVSSVGRAVDF